MQKTINSEVVQKLMAKVRTEVRAFGYKGKRKLTLIFFLHPENLMTIGIWGILYVKKVYEKSHPYSDKGHKRVVLASN